MHGAVVAWLRHVREQRPELFRSVRVLECGAYDINGSPRSFFADCDYVGLDWRPGPGVDVISLVHDYLPEDPFDVVVSTEMLEHDPYWWLSLQRMCEVLRPGGALLLSWASPRRAPHELHTAPEVDYYQGLAPSVVETLVAPHFQEYDLRLASKGNDVQLEAYGRLPC